MATKWERKAAMAAKIRELTLRRSKEKFELRELSLRRPKENFELKRASKSNFELKRETELKRKSISEEQLRKLKSYSERIRNTIIAIGWRSLKSEDKSHLLAEFVESLGGISEEEKTDLTSKLRESESVRAAVVSIAEAILAGGENPIDDDTQTPVEFPPINDDNPRTLVFVSPLKDELRLLRAWSLILVRLPAHDIQRFKLVCRLWRSIISSPGFASAHFSFSKSNPTGRHNLFVHETNPQGVRAPSRSIVYCFSFSPVNIVGSANGLICAVDNSPFSICILNPVTGHILKLPVPSSASSRFDYSTDSVAFVFWCDDDDDDDDDGEYKLAKIVSKPDNTTVASLWVSSSPETWSEISVGFKGSFYNPPCTVSGCDVVIEDVAYWIVFERKDDYNVGKLFVLSLDLKTLFLSLNENPFPLHFMEPEALCERLLCLDNSYLFAANWKGNFALVERDGEKKVYNVWTVDDRAEGGWRMSSSFAEDFGIKRCLTNSSVNGKSILTRVVGRNRIGISSFYVGTGEGEMIEGYRLGKCVTSAHDFVGSFVSIKGFKPPEDYGLTRLPRLRIVHPCPSFCFE